MKEARTFGQDFDEPSESAFGQYITWIHDKTNKKTASNQVAHSPSHQVWNSCAAICWYTMSTKEITQRGNLL
jgi:hypothetical protein